MTKFLLVDTFNILMRSRHVTRGDAFEKASLSIMIALNSIRWAWKKFGADHVVFCLEGRSWRKDFYKEYKANRAVLNMDKSSRDIDEDQIFFDAINDFMEFIDKYTNCTVLKAQGCEADDFIARWIQIFGADPTNEFTIVSTDTDFVQLISPQVQIYDGVNKKHIRSDGTFDEKGKPYLDKKGNPLPIINPEYALFEKCIRGDSSDNVASAYPGVRTKGSKKKVGIDEAFADRHNQGYDWVNFMKARWSDPFGEEHIVENDYKRNQKLIDLTQQPDNIKELLDEHIMKSIDAKDVKMIGLQFLKFCGRHELVKLAEQAESFTPILTAGFKSDLV